MKVELKTWGTLGLATALIGTGLAGCAGESGEGGEGGEAAQTSQTGEAGEGESGEGEGGEGEGGEGEGGENVGSLPIEQRLVFMAGHVEAGLALYRAGEAKAAAPHLMHPVSETHESERAGLEKLGFDPAPFERVSAALEEGKAASEIEDDLKAAEANIATMRDAAGGSAPELIRYLMEVAVEEYSVAVPGTSVGDAAEYQDAWGFVMVAKDLSASLEGDMAADVGRLLEEMLALWPEEAPIPPATPTPAGQISAQAAKVLLALPQPE